LLSALSHEQIAALESNPHIRLDWRGLADWELTPEQVAAHFESALIVYPHADEVAHKLDEFLSWYATGRGTGDPVAFAAEAQHRLISIHPFADGNGRLSRLVMDHALQADGLPPSLLRDPGMDYLVTSEVWAEEVRRGVIETHRTAARYAGYFNDAVRTGDLAAMAVHWAAIVGVAGSSPAILNQLYDGVCE
jgi:Fic family protein